MRAWRAARRTAFTPEVAATPLAATPYALRHACVSTWLNGGVPAAQVAEWAGHSVEVLLKVYPKSLDGQDELSRRRITQALGQFQRAMIRDRCRMTTGPLGESTSSMECRAARSGPICRVPDPGHGSIVHGPRPASWCLRGAGEEAIGLTGVWPLCVEPTPRASEFGYNTLRFSPCTRLRHRRRRARENLRH